MKVESQFMVPLRFSIYEGTINVFVHEYHSVYRKNVDDLVNELSEIDEEHRKVNVLSDQLITFFINGERLEHALDA
ncbi:hypothetical protein ACH0BF_19480 [Pseudobacillus sp. 179-B 2D1 NHS]|uniref:hypothetical protein n=1 Tax=Pseudobacillus sp. 179-B 2D1 NHS TaxID=3374292 RepID=UPI0038790901